MSGVVTSLLDFPTALGGVRSPHTEIFNLCPAARHEALYEESKLRRSRLIELVQMGRREHLRREMDECTFTPKVTAPLRGHGPKGRVWGYRDTVLRMRKGWAERCRLSQSKEVRPGVLNSADWTTPGRVKHLGNGRTASSRSGALSRSTTPSPFSFGDGTKSQYRWVAPPSV
jgi:hypothetical protein